MRKALYFLVALALIKLGLDLFIVWTYHVERLKGYRMSPSGEAPRNAILIFAQVPSSFPSIVSAR